jgi:hypothetical protein
MIAVDVGGRWLVGVEEVWSTLRRDRSHFSKVALCELKFLCMYKARLDKGAGFARALAVVLLVDEAAIYVDVFVEVTASTGEELPEVSGGDLTDVNADHVADLEDFAEDKD